MRWLSVIYSLIYPAPDPRKFLESYISDTERQILQCRYDKLTLVALFEDHVARDAKLQARLARLKVEAQTLDFIELSGDKLSPTSAMSSTN